MTTPNDDKLPDDPIVSDAEIARFVGPPDGKERLRRYIDKKVRALFPSPESPEADRVAKDAFDHAFKRWKDLTDKERQTDEYEVSRERDPDAKRNWVEGFLGLVALFALLCATLTVPGIATMLIVEANKIALVADWPVFGLVFGVTALAGILASIAYRDKLTSDTARLVFDRRLLKLTICVFLVWAATASLVAFPPTIGGGAEAAAVQSSSDWTKPPTVSLTSSYDAPVKLAPPVWLLFFVTALLDLVAAPALHNFVLGRVTPSPIRRPVMNAEHALLHNDLVEAAKTGLDRTAATCKGRGDADESWNAFLEMQVEYGLARLRQLNASVEAARNAAAEAALREALKKLPPKNTGSDEPEDDGPKNS